MICPSCNKFPAFDMSAELEVDLEISEGVISGTVRIVLTSERAQTAIHVANHPPFTGHAVNVPVASDRMATQAPEAPRPLDPLALDPVDVAQLDRIQELVDDRADLLKRIAMLKDVIAKMDKLFGAAIRERNEARDGEGVREVVLKAELRAEQRNTRNAIYLAALLFCALCWREGWRVAAWIWGML